MLHHVIHGEGRPVLILHGAKLDHRHMVETFEPMFKAHPGWKRVYPDMPGHGLSPARAGIASQLDLLNAVIDFATQALPGQSFPIIGESRGSYIAQGFAYKRPELVDGLGLITPGGSPTLPADRLPAHQVLVRDKGLRSELSKDELEGYDNLLVVQNRDITEKRRRAILPPKDLHDKAQAERVWAAFDYPFDLCAPEARFDKPSLMVCGRQDSWSGYADAIDWLPTYPRATLAVLDTAGHQLVWERPDLFRALVADWLIRLDQPAP